MLVRHAKSDWLDMTLSDFDRPLSEHGLASAPEMAERLAAQNLIPEYAVVSPALRAKTTAGIFSQKLNITDVSYIPQIYEASYKTLLKIINQLPAEYHFVALFGHNPGLSELLFNLSDEHHDMPTCAVAVLSFEFDTWDMISAGTATIEFYDYPKNGQ